jgi:medium-chain acyl-[acyl-carrier-protein] hydrolase
LFCFPYAGGNAAVFRLWPGQLTADIDVCLVQYPSRHNRMKEPAYTRLPPLVQALVQALLPHLDVPFAFFGHSMGALIGFELARQLRREHLPVPMHLFVSGCRAPQISNPQPPIHHLRGTEFVEQLRRRYDSIPQEILREPELLELLLPPLQADLAIVETYTYSADAPLDCPISAFGGVQDETAGDADLAAWRDQTSKSFELVMVPGGHFFLHQAYDRLTQAVERKIAESLNRMTVSH